MLCDQRKQIKRDVIFPFVQKVENLQQPECITSQQHNNCSSWQATHCKLGNAWFWLIGFWIGSNNSNVAERSQSHISPKQSCLHMISSASFYSFIWSSSVVPHWSLTSVPFISVEGKILKCGCTVLNLSNSPRASKWAEVSPCKDN